MQFKLILNQYVHLSYSILTEVETVSLRVANSDRIALYSYSLGNLRYISCLMAAHAFQAENTSADLSKLMLWTQNDLNTVGQSYPPFTAVDQFLYKFTEVSRHKNYQEACLFL